MKRTVCGLMFLVLIFMTRLAVGGVLIVDLEPEWIEIENDENGHTLVTISIGDISVVEGKRVDSAYLYIELSAVADQDEGQAYQYVTLAIARNGDGGDEAEEAVLAEYTLRAAQAQTTIFDLTQVYRAWARQDIESFPLYLKCIDPQEGAEIELSPNGEDAAGWLELRYSNRDE